jgi:hypothetical protein
MDEDTKVRIVFPEGDGSLRVDLEDLIKVVTVVFPTILCVSLIIFIPISLKGFQIYFFSEVMGVGVPSADLSCEFSSMLL